MVQLVEIKWLALLQGLRKGLVMKIAITGFAGAGKDTVAGFMKALLEQSETPVEIDRFAAPLKGAAASLFGETFDDRDVKEQFVVVHRHDLLAAIGRLSAMLDNRYDLLTPALEHFDAYRSRVQPMRYALSPREFQKVMGTNVVRRISPDAWAERVYRKDTSDSVMLIPDARFLNEINPADYVLLVYNGPSQQPRDSLHESEHLAFDLSERVDDQLGWPRKSMVQYKGKYIRVVDNLHSKESLELESSRILNSIMRGQ